MIRTQRHFLPLGVWRCFAASLMASGLTAAAAAADTLTFDELAAGSVLNLEYKDIGIRFRAVRPPGIPGDESVFAVVPCAGGPTSPPNALSIFDETKCPATNDDRGYIQVNFVTAQNRVSIDAVHTLSNTVSYLQAFNGDSLVDQVFGVPDGVVGQPQRLEIIPPLDKPRITSVRIGVFSGAGQAWFDNLGFDRRVDNEVRGWGPLKAVYR